jgi:ATP-dependent exoDNAse (exonuclease V) beta subunit
MRPRVPDLVASVERVRQSPVWREILAGDRREAEVPFIVRHEQPDGTVHLLRGVIDVAWCSGGRSSWHIADWKTDAEMSGTGLKSRHTEQVGTYVRIWTDLSDQPADGRIVAVGKA